MNLPTTSPYSWDGVTASWHHWHHGSTPLTLETPESIAARVRQIVENKPAIERVRRLTCFRPADLSSIPAYVKARAAYDKASAAYVKAWAALDKASAAYDKARAAHDKALHSPEVIALHAAQCRGADGSPCKWTPGSPTILDRDHA